MQMHKTNAQIMYARETEMPLEISQLQAKIMEKFPD